MANRETLVKLAADAARDPSRAARLAGYIADELRQIAEAGETAVPPGYLYAGAFEWLLSTENLEVEPLSGTGAVPITQSGNQYVQLRIPFDALIVGVSGWAEPVSTAGSGAVNEQFIAASLASAQDSRDLFTVSLAIDGQASFGTDGFNQLMWPASTVVGTRLLPRPMAWAVRRNSLLQAKFRNVTNVYLDGVSTEVMHAVILKKVFIGYTVLNLGRP